MIAGLLITTIFCTAVWLVFFRFRLDPVHARLGHHLRSVRRPHPAHLPDRPRFVTPASTDAKVVQYTIQLIPRLPEPTLVTAVLVEEGTHVKKGQTLFQFDRTVYESKVRQLEAELAEAKQNVKVLEADVALAEGKKIAAQANLAYAEYRQHAAETLRSETFGTVLQADQWTAEARRDAAAVNEADGKLKRAVLKLESEIGGVNTKVASVEAQLQQARYYLDNTTLVAPEDGRIVNLQVRPGMVSGIYRIGGIAAFIVDSDRYVLATYLPGEPEICPRRPAGRSRARSLSGADLQGDGRPDLAGERGGTVPAERRAAGVRRGRSAPGARPVRRADPSR